MQRISEEWWIGLDESYKTRVEDGSLVLWRPERTVWISIWNDRDGRTPRDRLAHWVAERDIRAADLFQESDGDLLRHGYLLAEPEETGGDRLGLYSYTVSTSSTVQMACTSISRKISAGRRPWPRASRSAVPTRPARSKNRSAATATSCSPPSAVHRSRPPSGTPRVSRAVRERARFRLALLPRRRRRILRRRSRQPRTLPALFIPHSRPLLRAIINRPAGTSLSRLDIGAAWEPSAPRKEEQPWN